MISAIAFLAATAAGVAAEPTKFTLQQQYEQAQTHALSGKCAEALPELEALAPHAAFKPGTLAGAMIMVLKGRCQIRIGQAEQGEIAIQQGLPTLRAAGPTLNVDVAGALMSLGDAAIMRWDYATARRYFEEVYAIPKAALPAIVNVQLARSMAFDGGEAPLRYASEAIKAMEATPGATKQQLAELRTNRARILLNQGRNEEAYADLKEALKLTGGLTLKANLTEVAIRGDLALAAKLTGDNANARKYLAYTGAGRIAQSPFSTALSMTPPVCGTETGLRPEDFAVVDFAIGPDGRVIQANTVYTRGSANVAAEFARAVSKWVWDPETIKKIPAFFLFASRVEIRCTTAGQEMPGLIAPLQNRFQTWSATQLGLVGSPDRDVLATQLAALASASNPTIDPVRQVAILGLRPIVEPMSWLARYNMIEKALAVAGTNAIPAEARNYLMISQLAARLGFNRGKGTADNGDLLSLLATPDIANDPLAADTLKLLVAMSNSDRQGSANAAELLQQVALDSKLPEQHPLRQASYLGLANAAAKKGDFAKAQDYFKATGLTEEQCAFLGVKPAVRRTGIDSSDFPSGAYEFGFEGWVSLEFDIQNNGVPAGIRPLIAYPPFVFSEAAAKSANSFLFESSYRPSGGNACSAERRTLVYRFP